MNIHNTHLQYSHVVMTWQIVTSSPGGIRYVVAAACDDTALPPWMLANAIFADIPPDKGDGSFFSNTAA